jgi:general secretion pathway protein D
LYKRQVNDYVNLSEQTTDSTKTITVGAASMGGNNGTNGGYGSNGGMSGMNNNRGLNNSGQGSGNSDFTTITSKSKFEFWDKLNDEIDTLLSRDGDLMQIESQTIINREAGIVTITGTKGQIDRVSRYLEKIKGRLHKQVMLETKLFELRYADMENTGVDWSKFTLALKGDAGNLFSNNPETPGGSNYSFSYQFSMDGLINFLDKYGHVNTLSTPKILTLNNQPAVINVGNQINYRYESGSVSATNVGSSTTNTYIMSSVFIGLTLNIVPEITDDGYVILRVNPVVSEELKDSENVSDDDETVVDENGIRIMPPDIKIKQLSSIVKAKDGSRVVIGGLISTRTQSIDSSVPLLSSVPVLGELFQHTGKETYKTELIIVITPKIINANTFPSIDSLEKRFDGSKDE